MMDLGIVHPSSSTWASPLHMVAKKTPGDWCPCGDYTGHSIAAQSLIDTTFRIPDFTASISGATILNKINLVQAYYQIPVEPEDVPETAVIITPFGFFEFLCMPFGLRNAAHRSNDLWTKSYTVSTFATHDILTASATPEEHLEHVRQVLERLAKHGPLMTSAYLECHPWTS